MNRKEDVIEFPFMIPPDFIEKMECPSRKRYIAFYWSARSDEIAWNDGESEGINKRPIHLWHAFMRQNPIARFLCAEMVDLGHSDSTADHWFLFDTVNRVAYVAPVPLVGRILKKQSLENITIGNREREGGSPTQKQEAYRHYG